MFRRFPFILLRMAFFTENTVDHLILPGNSCLLNYSVLNEYYSAAPFRSFSIKYVVDGTELYSINGTKYVVKNREYILANSHSEGYVEVGSRKAVAGICIDVAPDILSEVVASYIGPDTPVSDTDLDRFFNSVDFMENKYEAANTHLGACLLEVEKALKEDPSGDFQMNREFYLLLAEKIVEDHIPVFRKLHSIRAVKPATRKDLLRKVEKARDYIDLFYQKELSIAHIAREAGLSEYHFFRLFRAVYALSPHQYILRRRLAFAKELITQEAVAVSVAAVMSGFADVHAFSKAFRKFFGHAPSLTVDFKNSRI